MRQICLIYLPFFQNFVYSLVFKQFDRIVLFLFGIWIFSLPHSIWYLDFLNSE